MTNKITYNVGFNTDTTSLQKLKQELSALSQYKMDDLLKVNTNATQQDLKNLQSSISTIQYALDQSYNLKLDSTNIAAFQQELSKSGISLSQLQSNLAAAGVQGQIAFKSLITDLLTTNTQLKQTNNLLDSMGETLKNTIKWSIASSAVNTVTGSIQKAWNYSKRLDESLNNIRIVTGQSAEDMEKFAKKANSAAKALGTATTQYTNASLIYYQQGLSEEDVQTRTDITIKAANVTGQSAAEVSEQLTAVWNGYKVVAEEAELYVDKLAAVAASTAADLEELSDGMAKVASAASTMGIDIDQLSAQLATIVSVTRQDASSIGTALKTIYARMGDLKVDGVDEFGTSLGDVSGQMRQMGIEVLDQQGNLRDMGDVIEEIATKWDTWTDAQQQAAAVAMAGKRQYNNLIALFENWDMYESALTTSKTSAGTLQKQQDIYMESLEAHLEQLSTAGEKVYDAIFDSESMKDFIDVLTSAVNLFGDFVDSIGGGGNLLLNLGSIAMTVFHKQISGGIVNAWNNFTGMYYNVQAAANELRQTYEMAAIADEKQIPGLQQVIEMKQEELKYAKILTAEEKIRWDNNIKAVSAAQDKLRLAEEEVKTIKQQREEVEELLKTQKLFTTKDKKDIGEENRIAGTQMREGDVLTEAEIAEKRANGENINKDSLSDSYAFNLDTEAGRDAAIKTINDRLKEYENQSGYIEDMQGTLQDMSLDKNRVLSEALDYSEINIDNFRQNYQGDIEDLEALTRAQENLTEAFNKYNEAIVGSEEQEEAYKEVRKATRDVIKEHTAAVRKDTQALENAKKIIKNMPKEQKKCNTELKKARIELENATLKYKKFTKEIKSKAVIDGITKMVGGLSQMGAAIKSIISLGDIWTDDDLSDGEKILRTFQNLTITIPQMVSGVKALTSGFKSFSAVQNSAAVIAKLFNAEKQKELILSSSVDEAYKKEQIAKLLGISTTDLETKEIKELVDALNDQQRAQLTSILLEKQSTTASGEDAVAKNLEAEGIKNVGVAAKTTGEIIKTEFLPILLISLGLTAAFLTAVAVFTWFEKNSKSASEKVAEALEKAQETAERAKEELSELKDEYDSLMDSMTKYKDAKLAIDEMRVGTEEWQQAVRELNLQVLDLINTYPKLLEYIKMDEYGVYSIQQEGWTALEQDLTSQINKQQQVVSAANLGVTYAENELLKSKNKEKIEDTFEDYFNNKYLDKTWNTEYNSLTVRTAHKLNAANVTWETESYAENEKLIQVLEKFGAVIGEEQESDSSGYLQTKNKTITFDGETFSLIGKTDDEIQGLYSSIEDLDDEELQNEIRGLIEELSQNNKALSLNQQKIDEQTNAYLRTIADEKDLDADVYSNLTNSAINNANKKETTVSTDLSYYRKLLRLREDNNYTAFKNLVQNEKYELGDFDYSNLDDEKIWGTINTPNDRKSAKRYVEEMYHYATGKTVTINSSDLNKIKVDEIGAFEFTDSEGNLVKFDSILDLAATKMMNDTINKASANNGKTNEELLTELKEAGISQKAAYFIGNNYRYLQDGEFNWESANLFDLANLTQYANQLDDGENNYSTNLDDFIKNFKKDVNEILEKSKLNKDFSVSDAIFANFTLDDYTAFATNIKKAAAVEGGQAAITELFHTIESPEIAKKVNELMSTVDFTDSASVNEFRSELLELGINIENSSEAWEKFVNTVNDGNKQWISDQEKVIENFKSIQDIAGELSAGDIISLDDFKELSKIAPEIADMFIQTADGMKLIASNTDLNKALIKQYKNLSAIKTQYEEIRKAAENVDSDAFFNIDTFKTKSASDIAKYFTKNRLALAEALGEGNTSTIQEQLKILKTEETDSVAYLAAEETLANFAEKINQAAIDAAQGLFSSTTAEELWATTIAESWSEVAESDISEDVKDDARTMWKYTYLTDLGMALSKELVEKIDIVELEEQLINYRELELDYYQDLNNELDILGRKIERAFGKDKLALLDEQIELQGENLSIAQSEAGKAENYFNFILGTKYSNQFNDENGNFSLSKALDYQATLEPDTEEYTNIESIIDAYISWQDKIIAISDAQESILDSQIEKYNQEIEMNREFRNTVKEWRNTIRDFKRVSTEGIAAFEALSAGQTLTNIMNELNAQGMGATNPASFDEIPQLESWANERGINNPFVGEDGTFDKNAFKEAYASAMETAQEDVQELFDLGQDLFDTWLDALEEISEIYDEQAKKLSTINSLLESSASLNQLFGNKSSQYFTQMRNNAERTVEIYAAQVEQLEEQYNEFFDEEGKLREDVSQDQADAVWEAYTAAKQNYVDAIQEQYDAIVAEFEISMQEIINDLFGGSMNNFSELWNLQNSADEMYFDDVNAEYEKYKFERAVQSSIDATDSITAQNKLKNVLNEQLKILEQKDKLSQYDIDRANAMYDLTLKQIALEEAQQTANKMKLTRDANGNYTYQYVADEDKIAQAEEELAAAENDLYNLQKDHQSELIDTMISGVQEYQELTIKYMNDPEMLAKIQDHYSTFFGNLKGDMEELGIDISELTEIFESDMSTPWMDTFNTLAEIDVAGLLESTADLFSEENGITAALQLVQNNFSNYLNEEKSANERLTEYVKSTEELNAEADTLADKMDEANAAITSLIENLGILVTNLDGYADKYTRYLAAATGNPLDTGEEKAPDEEMAENTVDSNDTTNKELAANTKLSTELEKEMITALWTVNDTLIKLPISSNIQITPPEIGIPTPVPAPGNYFTQIAGTGVNNKGITTGINFGNPLIIK